MFAIEYDISCLMRCCAEYASVARAEKTQLPSPFILQMDGDDGGEKLSAMTALWVGITTIGDDKVGTDGEDAADREDATDGTVGADGEVVRDIRDVSHFSPNCFTTKANSSWRLENVFVIPPDFIFIFYFYAICRETQ